MRMKSKTKKRQPLRNSFFALGNEIKSAYKNSPLIVVTLGCVSIMTVSFIAKYAALFEAISTLIVLAVAILVYVRTNNFGEASLSLVAGVLAVFTVSWDYFNFIIFVTVWIGFALTTIAVSSLKLVTKLEAIRVRTALRIDTENYESVMKTLELQSSASDLEMLGPIQRAETQLVLAYNNISLDSMADALKAVEQIHTATGVEHRKAAVFVADIVAITKEEQNLGPTIEDVYSILQTVPLPPEEVFDSIKRTKYLVLTRDVDENPLLENQCLRTRPQSSVCLSRFDFSSTSLGKSMS
jgi:hypothetical protein